MCAGRRGLVDPDHSLLVADANAMGDALDSNGNDRRSRIRGGVLLDGYYFEGGDGTVDASG